MTLAFKARVNDEAVASYRYRVLAPIAFLSARGHAVELYDEANFDRYDTVVFSKAYGPEDRKLARRLRAAGRRVLLDLCDDHFYNPSDLPRYRKARDALLAMIALCQGVVCSTPVLARAVQREARLRETPAVAPDVFEQANVIADDVISVDQPARLVWFGRHGSPNAPAGMADLELIRDRLAEAFALRPFELVICSDSLQRYEAIFADWPVPTRFAAWSPRSFSEELARADAVLIPLSDNPFVAAKTHNRLSLALSAGVPVVADRLDSYAEFAPFAYVGDWPAGLEAVLLRPGEARARAAGARGYLEAHWSPPAVAPLWETALGLPDGARPIALRADPQRLAVHFFDWQIREGRSRRPWLLAGADADPAAVAAARAEGSLVVSLGAAAAQLPADLAYVADAELLQAEGASVAANAAALLVPADLCQGGWPAGRSLASWAADLPILARLREQGRLVRFDLPIDGPLTGEGPLLRLLAEAGVSSVRTLGLVQPPPSSTGFADLPSILERRFS